MKTRHKKRTGFHTKLVLSSNLKLCELYIRIGGQKDKGNSHLIMYKKRLVEMRIYDNRTNNVFSFKFVSLFSTLPR